MTRMFLLTTVSAGLVLTAVPAVAHHSFAAEFTEKKMTISGAIAKMDWINPHGWLHIDVKKPDGKVEQWAIETPGPSALLRRGITKKSITIGEVVTVEGYLARDGGSRMAGRMITRADGRQLIVAPTGGDAPTEPEQPK